MKRIAILTAGGDTPALNATLYGAVTRGCQERIEVYGIIKGFSGLLNPNMPHVHLNPLFLIAITSALMGMQSIGTGILAELIVRTHFESQRKTSYAIAARVGFPPEQQERQGG